MTDPQKNLPASLLHAYQLDGKGSATSIDKLEESEGSWFHFDISGDEITPWMTGVAGLNDIAANALTSTETRPRVLRRGNNLIMTLRGLSIGSEHGLEEMISARLADDMNRKTYLFTIVAVIFLPLGFLTGLLGVNVGGVPGLEEPQAFVWLILACLTISLGMLAFFRWRRWF